MMNFYSAFQPSLIEILQKFFPSCNYNYRRTFQALHSTQKHGVAGKCLDLTTPKSRVSPDFNCSFKQADDLPPRRFISSTLQVQ